MPAFYDHSPMFDDCRRLTKNRQWQTWPDCNELNGLWPDDNTTRSGFITRFVDQASIHLDGKYYEEYIYEYGEIPTRNKNWHDFFNAMVWLQFPKTKSLINALHVEEMYQQLVRQQQKTQHRTRKRDALTLFDESGVVFVTTVAQNIHNLKQHHWKKLYYENRKNWWRSIAVFIFGHGLYEKALTPYIGMTGNALICSVPDFFFRLDRQEQIDELDTRLAEKIPLDALLQRPSCLTPLPLLGVPGWWEENEKESFYENKKYFRPKREKPLVSHEVP